MMADILKEFAKELDEQLKDPYKRIMVTINTAAMEPTFYLDNDEVDMLVSNVRALKEERDALTLEAGAVAALVEAARKAVKDLAVSRQSDWALDSTEIMRRLNTALMPIDPSVLALADAAQRVVKDKLDQGDTLDHTAARNLRDMARALAALEPDEEVA
jgi:hypothetical protein